jgi:hypothetical protein
MVDSDLRSLGVLVSSYFTIIGREHITVAGRRWRLVLKTVEKHYEGLITESPEARLVINLMHMVLPNILKCYHFIKAA